MMNQQELKWDASFGGRCFYTALFHIGYVEYGRNDHRKDATHFNQMDHQIPNVSNQKLVKSMKTETFTTTSNSHDPALNISPMLFLE